MKRIKFIEHVIKTIVLGFLPRKNLILTNTTSIHPTWLQTPSKTLVIILLVTLQFFSCESVSVQEPNFLLSNNSVFQDDSTAESAVVGIYSQIMSGSSFASGGQQSITFLAGLSADNFTNYSFSADENQFYTNALNATNTTLEQNLWNQGYNHIYAANSVLEGLAGSMAISAETNQRLTGEAKFIRAFCHFYLVNLFGDVPLVTSTDYLKNSSISRTPKEEVYQQIISDLLDAKGSLPDDYTLYSGERTRPTSFAASALLARTYLYTEQWTLADEEATELIERPDIFELESNLNDVFLNGSREAIWQLMPVLGTQDTWEGLTYILNTTPPTSVTLSDGFINAFDPMDSRYTQWTSTITDDTQTYHYPFKYKIKSGGGGNEYSMVLRLAEQFLIRAEARAQLGNIPDASTDLNTIRNRAGLSDTVVNDQNGLLNVLAQERRFEFFAEWGHRWLDLKRTSSTGAILTPIKQDWQETDNLYPIPQKEIQNNPNLMQNPGY